MLLESRSVNGDKWRVDQRDPRFYGRAGINRKDILSPIKPMGEEVPCDIILALHGDTEKPGDRTFRLRLSVEEATAIREALDKAIKQLAEIEAQEAREPGAW